MSTAEDFKPIANNRRARHEYEILETVEAGLVLRGTEVKSLRAGQVTFKDSYATIRNSEAWLRGCHISPYSHGTDANHEAERDRKLLLHQREISRLTGKIAERGLTLVPLRLYFKKGRAARMGLARKKLHDSGPACASARSGGDGLGGARQPPRLVSQTM
jgi:SsrA-binding protein